MESYFMMKFYTKRTHVLAHFMVAIEVETQTSKMTLFDLWVERECCGYYKMRVIENISTPPPVPCLSGPMQTE